jgi:hypothetical protein
MDGKLEKVENGFSWEEEPYLSLFGIIDLQFT